jgi:hypothetical protein
MAEHYQRHQIIEHESAAACEMKEREEKYTENSVAKFEGNRTLKKPRRK